MEMWEWLKPWWAWWSWITCLFDWTAIGAIGGIAVLWFAVRGAQANQRFERQKAIMRLGLFLRLARKEEWAVSNDVFRNPNRKVAAERVLARMRERGTASVLLNFDFETLPSLATAEAARMVPEVLRQMEGTLGDVSAGVLAADDKLRAEVTWLASLLQTMRDELNQLRRSHKPLLRRIVNR